MFEKSRASYVLGCDLFVKRLSATASLSRSVGHVVAASLTIAVNVTTCPSMMWSSTPAIR